MKLAISLIAPLPLMVACGIASAATPYYPADQLSKVIQGPQRSVDHKLRDKYRHPHQTLEFFGLESGMTVVELAPGGGWYTEILAPYLKNGGQLIEAAPPLDSDSDFMRRMAKQYRQKLKAGPDIYGQIKIVSFAPPRQVDLGQANSADLVLTFRNAHDWAAEGALQSVLNAAYKVLKPGGVLGLVAHRANPGTDWEKDANDLSRLPEAYVINAAQKAGFTLSAVSRINANPADPRTTAVFKLPPARNADQFQPVFDHIGESDRMTLRFVKEE